MTAESVRAATAGEKRVAVAFSGGLDSSILATCAAKEAEVVACTAYSEGARDQATAREAASAMGIELVATELTKEDAADGLGRIELPFVPTLMDRSLWCLYSVVARSAKEAGAEVMLLGQLADELFGGYAKYAEALKAKGPDAATSMMEADVREYAKRGRVRDVAACCRWVEPRFPFEAPGLTQFAMGLPVQFKIRDGVRKAVLRRAAAILGVPEAQAGAEKKAAQYSSGVQKLVSQFTLLTPQTGGGP
ncbi:MAG TPA: asparagine synthase C-terminal domain-containing protein [Nitrososphaerales archaeon]|nr:asparagine synthase C-terminal domain-containing protein [Nitrososphaerales archaeon]